MNELGLGWEICWAGDKGSPLVPVFAGDVIAYGTALVDDETVVILAVGSEIMGQLERINVPYEVWDDTEWLLLEIWRGLVFTLHHIDSDKLERYEFLV